MTLSTFIAFVSAAVVIIVIPGPTNLTIVSASLNSGARRSLWTVVGAALSHTGFIIVTTAGVGAVVSLYPRVLIFIKWLGVMYLAIQGIRLLVRKPKDLVEGEAAPARGGIAAHIIKGFIVNTTNPKAVLFYASFFPPFVDPREAFLPQFAVLAVTFLVIFVVIGSAHALAGNSARKLLATKRHARTVNRISGSVMIGAAVWLATKH